MGRSGRFREGVIGEEFWVGGRRGWGGGGEGWKEGGVLVGTSEEMWGWGRLRSGGGCAEGGSLYSNRFGLEKVKLCWDCDWVWLGFVGGCGGVGEFEGYDVDIVSVGVPLCA